MWLGRSSAAIIKKISLDAVHEMYGFITQKRLMFFPSIFLEAHVFCDGMKNKSCRKGK